MCIFGFSVVAVIKCKGLDTPDHGSKTCYNDNNLYGTNCYFSCDTGYKLKGLRKSSCELNGYFNHSAPTCNSKCSDYPYIVCRC